MRRVDGFHGKKFLTGVLVAYFMVFFFSYIYFMTASSLISGNAIVETEKENYNYMGDPALIKTFWVVLILVMLVIFLYIVPKIIHKKQLKQKKPKVERYSAFRNH